MKRIFIAIKVKAGINFSNIIKSLKSGLQTENIKWTNPDNIHITMVFIGETAEQKINIISSKLREQCDGIGEFELIIKGLGVFKSIKDPRVIWTGIEQSEKLTQLYVQIINGLKDSGVLAEERPFKPHLTIGRIKYLKDKTVLNALVERYQNKEIQKIAVNQVILYESILLPSGPLYKQLTKIEL